MCKKKLLYMHLCTSKQKIRSRNTDKINVTNAFWEFTYLFKSILKKCRHEADNETKTKYSMAIYRESLLNKMFIITAI